MSAERQDANAPRLFYGWPLVAVGFVVYGFGMAPAYYSWGFFAPEIMADVGLSRRQIGEVFGAFGLVFSIASPVAAYFIRSIGLRASICSGALLAAVGFFMTSRADSFADFLLSYSLIGGFGIGLSTILASQSIAVFWFKRYRARAVAVIMLGAAVVGAAVNPINALVLEQWDWRFGWVLISFTSVAVAVVAAIFIRNRPEDLGQRRDGRAPHASESAVASADDVAGSEGGDRVDEVGLSRGVSPRSLGVMEAMRTTQFWIVVFAGLSYSLSWRVLSAHGRLHLENLGFATTVAAGILGVRVGVSAFGRLSGSLGDFLSPARVMAIALATNASGLFLLINSRSTSLATLAVVLIGVGYGASYISGPVVSAHFFGRDAFVGTASVRIALVGIIGFVGPSWAGAVADRTGSYGSTLVVLGVLCLLGAVGMAFCRSPRASPAAESQSASG